MDDFGGSCIRSRFAEELVAFAAAVHVGLDVLVLQEGERERYIDKQVDG